MKITGSIRHFLRKQGIDCDYRQNRLMKAIIGPAKEGGLDVIEYRKGGNRNNYVLLLRTPVASSIESSFNLMLVDISRGSSHTKPINRWVGFEDTY